MKSLKNQSGQGTVEMVLLMAIVVGISIAVTNYLQSSGFAQKLFGDPWSKLSGMIECGTWEKCSPTDSHPGSFSRTISYDPKR